MIACGEWYWIYDLQRIRFNFLEEISRLSHFIAFLYLFALITEEGFLISPYYLTLHSNGYIFPFLLCLSLLY